MPPPTPRTPLRRLSQGSLSRLSRSGAYPDAPHGLGFLEPALAELIDEAETLQTNAEGLCTLERSLAVFNESFASLLYVMNMHALTTDFPQAPSDASFALASRRAEEDARAALEAIRAAETAAAARRPPTPEKTTTTDRSAGDHTATTDATMSTQPDFADKPKSILKRKGPRKLTAKEKRERGLELEKILAALPLEFRGDDPNLRRNIEQVIEKFLDNPGDAFNIMAFVRLPELNQARANKCLIALVNRKIVIKENSTGTVLYHWQGPPP
ncbi:uncharacterized protein BXZ73DRAFT_50006 [Epithele typhae]|uniref:uncharacterized protein n=1 Tax=Epithele typhae TaxID=378194 RepID=UPI002007C411|nr:uncharacterized protein BXZ73DRAFT_50006 [Epithele typhae]KAH9925448.1 hypothetical protein BXZ73DRAFT_50006 [Epithele typhae]